MKTPAGLCAIVLLAFVGVVEVMRAQKTSYDFGRTADFPRTIVANALAGAMR
jgi:hypothetical protein